MDQIVHFGGFLYLRLQIPHLLHSNNRKLTIFLGRKETFYEKKLTSIFQANELCFIGSLIEISSNYYYY